MTCSADRRGDVLWRPPAAGALLALCLLAWGALAARSLSGRAWLDAGAAEVPSRVQAAREKIDPNTASVASLRRLPLIGPERARRIVAHRQDRRASGRGPFRRPEDLMRKGDRIAEGIVERIRPHLVFDGTAGP